MTQNSNDLVQINRDGPLWHVRLNRPDRANALTGAMLQDLLDIVSAADGQASVLVLSGTGTVFSAGADLDEARAGLATSPLWEEFSGAIARLPCMTIAALNGTLAGGAFGMALACDMRIAVEEARFFYPVMKLGYLPQPSDPRRLTALIGPARAKMILMGGRKIDAATALSWGLVDQLVQRDALETAISVIVADALSAGSAHVAAIKGMVT